MSGLKSISPCPVGRVITPIGCYVLRRLPHTPHLFCRFARDSSQHRSSSNFDFMCLSVVAVLMTFVRGAAL